MNTIPPYELADPQRIFKVDGYGFTSGTIEGAKLSSRVWNFSSWMAKYKEKHSELPRSWQLGCRYIA